MNLAEAEPLEQSTLWLRFQQRRVGAGLALAIGGPRESEAPGIYARTARLLRALFGAEFSA